MRSYGFRFIVQADWILPSSREAITETEAANQVIRDELPIAFARAAEILVRWACNLPEVTGVDTLDILLSRGDDEDCHIF